MKSNKNVQFYQSLGKLFYAIAIADKDINVNEIAALKELIQSDWAFDSNAEHIKMSFSEQVVEHASGSECFQDFVDFKNEHKHMFNEDLNGQIINTAGAIADAFSKKNKSELIMLAQLAIELRK